MNQKALSTKWLNTPRKRLKRSKNIFEKVYEWSREMREKMFEFFGISGVIGAVREPGPGA